MEHLAVGWMDGIWIIYELVICDAIDSRVVWSREFSS